jgi:hypothetical protein
LWFSVLIEIIGFPSAIVLPVTGVMLFGLDAVSGETVLQLPKKEVMPVKNNTTKKTLHLKSLTEIGLFILRIILIIGY